MTHTQVEPTVTYGVFGKGMLKNNAQLQAFLQAYNGQDAQVKRVYPLLSTTDGITAMLGWGRKKSYHRASRFALRHQMQMLTLEDGFLRSLDSGKSSRHACSMVVDPIGIYFDAKAPSYLEQLIITSRLTHEQQQRAERLIATITHERLSKYNSTAKTGTLTGLDFSAAEHVLLIDQVAGDQSIAGAGASKKSFAKMLKAAQRQYPNAQLWVKAHPAGKLGYLTELKLPPSVRVISTRVNPIELLERIDAVYTVSSHMGFEALMLGKAVHCFGVPWYSGWGLTDDSQAPSKVYQQAYQRRGALLKPNLAQLFTACYLRYSQYVDPATGRACQIEPVLDWLITNRHWRDKLPHDLTVYELSFWKYGFLKAFLATSQAALFFKPKFKLKTALNPKQVSFPKTEPFLVWGFAKKRQLARKLHNTATPIWCMEDGFIRSNGLGASLIEPLSVVLDQSGIYYNATEPSDLEQLLQVQPVLTTEQHTRVQALITRLLAQQVSKYNVGMYQPLVIQRSHSQQAVILVVGQVEDDMSVKLCASDITTNLALLQRVRTDNPDAYIIYKPHPDVEAGLRTGKIAARDMQRHADQVVTDIAMPVCLAAVDAVHTMSSLTGFEALLRGLAVTCYGLPFYAGWGLTTDKAQNAVAEQAKQRRARTHALNLAQLVYATLIDYPLYRIPQGYGLAQVEQVIDYLYPTSVDDQVNAVQPSAKSSFTQQAKLKLMQTRQRIKRRLPKDDANDA